MNNKSKITAAFSGKKCFAAYLMAGDPSLAKTREYIAALAEGGADIIEIGIPFSDPIAEGEVIQAANLRAKDSGATLDAIFALTADVSREVAAPLVLMGYLNPVFRYGYERFFKRCAECAVSGVIIPDLPFEESAELRPFADEHGVDLITLVAPTSAERIAKAVRDSRGYVYLVSSMGVTGARSEITTDLKPLVAEIRRNTDTPVAVGFGIHSPEQAAKMRALADGVIVGSAIVDIIARGGGSAAAELTRYVRSMTAETQYN
ncbi:MAG: tryptophan synthase subunit alpha [Oscillospiraceae bacterium]|jgi:tryptophan synthase alpha chain|nr:tryptophan synthase subunit alpha [Oscillospiraceae bacterium]